MGGDRIVKIDGKNVAGIKIKDAEVMKRLKGQRGTLVTVSIFRKGLKKLKDFTITRNVIPTYSVDIAYMPNSTTGYIKLSKFSASTYDEMVAAISKLEKQGIIDGYEVRLNPARFDRSLIAFILVSLQPQSDESELGRVLAAIPDVQEVHHVAGEDGFMVKLRAADTAHLERIRREKIAALPHVRSTRTLIVLQTYKETARIPLDDSAIQKLKKRRS